MNYPSPLVHRWVREHIIEYLKLAVPARVAATEAAAGYVAGPQQGPHPYLPVGIIPPVDWDGFDPLDVLTGDYPSIGLYVNTAGSHRRMDLEPGGGSKVQSTWSCVLSVACTNNYLGLDADGVDSYEEPGRIASINNCHDLTGIVKQCILDSPNFNFDLRSTDSEIELVDGSLSVNFSEPIQPNQKRSPIWATVAQMNFQIVVAETVSRPSLGVVRQTFVQTRVVEQ